jgi:hypothetical protein
MVMSSQMLIVFALFVDRIQNGHHRNNGPVEEAMGVLTFFLFIAYGVFGMLLIVFHREIVKEGQSVPLLFSPRLTSTGDGTTTARKDTHVHEEEERAEDLPPENI